MTARPAKSHMQRALEEARAAGARGEVPVGAVIIAADGKEIAAAGNETRARNDPTAHAEMLAIRAASGRLGVERLADCDLYVTLEPCPMCAAAISFARIRRLYYGASDPKSGGVEGGARIFSHASCHHAPEIYSGVGADDASALLSEFFHGLRATARFDRRGTEPTGRRPMKLLGQGMYWQDMKVGDRLRTFGRTITEPDIVAFIGVTGMLEVLFTNEIYRQTESAIKGRLAPGALVYAIAEGLTITGSIQGTGLAFLGMQLDVKAPTFAGDTIHVEIEVLESRATSKGGRGIVRTRNSVVNQRGEVVMVYTPVRMMKGHP